MKTQTRTVTPAQACADLASVFQNPLLEEDLTPTSAAARRELAQLRSRAEAACIGCPMMQRCLYTAIVEHDVAGYVAGTTSRQRRQIRAMLGVRVEPENLDTIAGVVASGRQIDPVEVARLRAANPHESLETLAERLGCSLSTVKRHLRKVRHAAGQPELAGVRPSLEQVQHAAGIVVGGRRQQVLAA